MMHNKRHWDCKIFMTPQAVKSVNTYAPRLIQAVRTKTAGLHVALRGNFSGPVSATNPVKSSRQVLWLALEKNVLVGVVDFL